MVMDFPLIYCNGDSYSDENFNESLANSIYANFVAKVCNGFVINSAISGSCNRRIIRSSCHDLILQRQLNPDQKIIALIGLSFESRSEVWVDDYTPTIKFESNFDKFHFTKQLNWRENLLNNKSIDPPVDVLSLKNKSKNIQKFYTKLAEGRAFFYSPYAERINLLTDLIMFRALMDSLNVDFLIFQSPRAEKLESEYLLDFFKKQIDGDHRFFDLENFGFVDWCALQNKFKPLDYHDRPFIAHYGSDAHEAFANEILIPKLKELKIL